MPKQTVPISAEPLLGRLLDWGRAELPEPLRDHLWSGLWILGLLFKVLGTVRGLVLAMAAVQVLRGNTKLLPPELRPSWWRRARSLACSVFYGSLSAWVVWNQAVRLLG